MNKESFKAEIIADSVNPSGNRLTTYLLTYPRFIHSELMTHRAFSRNAASSRAIPISKVIDQVNTNPSGPIRWGINGKGMQDHGIADEQTTNQAKDQWKTGAAYAVQTAELLSKLGIHKQIANRVLEPYVWMTTLVSATEFENFFSLRVHKDAQPEFQYLSYLMLKKYLNNEPTSVNWGDWHIPFSERMPDEITLEQKLKVSTARAARTSYLTIDGKIEIEKDFELHDRLAESGHFSPFEHSAFATKEKTECNFVGWQQYRCVLKDQNRKCDLNKLLNDYEKERDL